MKKSDILQAASCKLKKLAARCSLLASFLVFTIVCSLFTAAWAATISSDHMEYFKEEDKYILTGNVKIEREDSTLMADKVIFYQKTADAEAEGNVVYEDPDALINTEKAEVNLETKTGRLYNAVIFFKKENYWITGDNLSKIKEDHYYASSATFTTCDAKQGSRPDWCFKGRDVNILVGKKVTAKDVTYNIKGLPILYSPYLWAPVKTKRETGFLFPVIGNSSTKGFQFSPAFFWAIDENKDATLYLDYYTKRGIGIGAEYRYLDFNGRGEWNAYYIKDRELDKDFFELRGLSKYATDKIKGYLEINYVNEDSFYKEYAAKVETRIRRFLQSSGEISLQMNNSRLYLLGQYWIDLNGDEKTIPQKLPELGYTINPSNIGPLTLTMSSSIANFHSEEGPRGQRIDINPTLFYSFGDKIQFFQSLSLRATGYNLEDASPYGSSPHRETFEYNANALVRFKKHYESFTHIIEPSIQYSFIPETHELPLFDPTELFDKTSIAQISISNIIASKKLVLSTRLIQPFDFNAGDRSLLPTKLEAYIIGPFALQFDASYDLNKGRLETFNSEISIELTEKTILKAGERFNRDEKVMLYKAAIDSVLSQKWAVNATAWYDAKGGGLRDSMIKTTYTEQCWALHLILSRKPGENARPTEYSLALFFELKGIGSSKIL